MINPSPARRILIATALLLLGCGGSGGAGGSGGTTGAAGQGGSGASSRGGTGGTAGVSGTGGTAAATGGGGSGGTAAGTGGGSGGTAGGGGAGDPCNPPCLARLYGGCLIGGTCVYQPGNFCYSNGVIVMFSTPGGPTRETITKNGVLCATLDAIGVFRDPNGASLGSMIVYADGSLELDCTGEDPVTVPNTCPAIPCAFGMCPP